MPLITDEKKQEFWDHFADPKMLNGLYGYSGRPFGKRALARAKAGLWDNNSFWNDIILRHGGLEWTPEQMKNADIEVYNHCFGNFCGGIAQYG